MNWKLLALMFAIGLPGVVAVAWLVTPTLLAGRELPAPLDVVVIATAIQSAVLLAIAAAIGAWLAPRVGLHAPLLEAWLTGRSTSTVLQAQWLPGLIGAAFGAGLLHAFVLLAPEPLSALQDRTSMPLLARVLYGGLTEEVLVRWGLMTLLLWLFWRVVQGGVGEPSAAIAWAAIIVSALVFGLAHLPTVSALLGELRGAVPVYVVFANAAFGLVAGFLYWRHGLEAAAIAHVGAHLGAALLSTLRA